MLDRKYIQELGQQIKFSCNMLLIQIENNALDVQLLTTMDEVTLTASKLDNARGE